MSGKIITFLFVLFLVVFACIVVGTSKIKSWKPEKKLFKKLSLFPELAVGPTVYIRNEKEREKGYKSFEVRKPVFKIGRGFWCDLRIEEPYIAGIQAEIRQKRENGDVYFSLTNMGKTNIAEYLNQEHMKYEWMDYRDEMELGEKEAFYFGDMKVVIVTPKPGHEVAKSDRDIIKDKDVAQTERKSTDRSYDKDWYDV